MEAAAAATAAAVQSTPAESKPAATATRVAPALRQEETQAGAGNEQAEVGELNRMRRRIVRSAKHRQHRRPLPIGRGGAAAVKAEAATAAAAQSTPAESKQAATATRAAPALRQEEVQAGEQQQRRASATAQVAAWTLACRRDQCSARWANTV